MVSVYQTISQSDLETYIVEDFSAVNPDYYTDAVVCSWITQAERIVNGYTNITWGNVNEDTDSDIASTIEQTPTGTIISTVLNISSIIAINQLIRDGYEDPRNGNVVFRPIESLYKEDGLLSRMLGQYREEQAVIGFDSVERKNDEDMGIYFGA